MPENSINFLIIFTTLPYGMPAKGTERHSTCFHSDLRFWKTPGPARCQGVKNYWEYPYRKEFPGILPERIVAKLP